MLSVCRKCPHSILPLHIYSLEIAPLQRPLLPRLAKPASSFGGGQNPVQLYTIDVLSSQGAAALHQITQATWSQTSDVCLWVCPAFSPVSVPGQDCKGPTPCKTLQMMMLNTAIKCMLALLNCLYLKLKTYKSYKKWEEKVIKILLVVVKGFSKAKKEESNTYNKVTR